MLIADPLFQIAPNCLLVGQAAKNRLAKAEARYDDERGGYPASVHSMKVISAISIAIREMTNLAS